MSSFPYQIQEQMIQCFGRCFHYKDPVVSFMRSCGVPISLINKYRDEPKFVWARKVIQDLDNEDGRIILQRLLTEFCKLRTLPDSEVKDKNAGLDALRQLKQLAISHQLFVEETNQKSRERRQSAEALAKIKTDRADKLAELKNRFSAHLTGSNRQAAGYTLEEILYELFTLFEIEYRKPYRTSTQQIDGHFRFEGFDYLVEAKWRQEYPTEQEIGGFEHKVNNKLESTRGLFVSILGFRPEVIRQYEGRGANIIFMDGPDLTTILEGRVHLGDALRLKIEKAAQEGIVYCPIR